MYCVGMWHASERAGASRQRAPFGYERREEKKKKEKKGYMDHNTGT